MCDANTSHLIFIFYLNLLLFYSFSLGYSRKSAHFARPTGPARKAANESVGRPALCITRLFHPGE